MTAFYEFPSDNGGTGTLGSLWGGEKFPDGFIRKISLSVKERISKEKIMYTAAELFVMASDPATSHVAFLNNVTMATPDDASGFVDLDAEKARLSTIWEMARLSMRELVSRTGLSQTAFAKGAGIPLRTVQNWCAGSRDCSAYVRFLLAEHYGLLKSNS